MVQEWSLVLSMPQFLMARALEKEPNWRSGLVLASCASHPGETGEQRTLTAKLPITIEMFQIPASREIYSGRWHWPASSMAAWCWRLLGALLMKPPIILDNNGDMLAFRDIDQALDYAEA